MLDVLWGKKFNQSSIQNAQVTSAVGEEGRLTFRNAVAVLAVLFCLHSHNSFAVTDDTIPFNIPQQRADRALTQFAEQANLTLVFPFEQLKDKTANRLVGDYPIATAINLLLHNTGLTPRFSDQLVLTIASEPKGKRMNTTNSSKRKTVLAGLVGLFAAGGMTQAVAQGGEAAMAQSAIDEIIVTANKREQSLQDAALSISALTEDDIDKRSLVSMDDYLRTLPGVSMQDRGASQNSIVIRGLASDPQTEDSSVGVYFGETPVTGLGSVALGASSGGSGSADIKLVDIDRVEVLRGPQGTLYGSGSMGGTVRVIPNPPNLDQLEGKLAARYSQTGEQGSGNNMLQGIFNIPLIEGKLATRLVAYRFDNSGYIDNVAASQPTPQITSAVADGGVAIDRSGVGSELYKGVRLTTLWAPTDRLSLSLSYIQQDIEQDGIPEVSDDLTGNFQQVRLRTGALGDRDEFLGSEVDITSLVIEYDLGWGNLTSATSWVDYSADGESDGSFIFSTPVVYKNKGVNTVLVEEIRLSSQFDGPLQFIAGIYYEDNEDELIFRRSSITNIAFNLESDQVIDIEQYAVFGELTYNLTDQLSATIGARYFDYEKQVNRTSPNAAFFLDLNSKEKGQTYKFNLSYSPGDDTLVYAQWAEGFRLGKPQGAVPSTCDLDGDGLIDGLGVSPPGDVDSDNSENFELGLKTSLADNRVRINASVYRINWEGMPLTLVPPCRTGIGFNAGESKSEGIELEAQAGLTENFQVYLSAAYGEAILTEDVPFARGFGEAGDNLPGSSDYNIGLGFEYGFNLSGNEGFVRADYSYIGEYYHNFSEEGQVSGGFGQVNVKTGMTFENIGVDLFVNNLTNANEFTWVETVLGNALGTTRAYRIRPRTIGINLAYRF